MRRPTLAAAAIATAFLMGCDRIPFIGGGEEEASPPAPPVTQPADTTTRAAQPAAPPDTAAELQEEPEVQQPVATPPTPPRQVAQGPTARGMDEPWTPTHTGTVSPGMSREAVIGVWGEPVAQRASGEWTYLYYRNGCEYTCGTFDVVMLQGGEVVDAIVRGRGHIYSGVSSSPAGSEGQFTPPGGGSLGGFGMPG